MTTGVARAEVIPNQIALTGEASIGGSVSRRVDCECSYWTTIGRRDDVGPTNEMKDRRSACHMRQVVTYYLTRVYSARHHFAHSLYLCQSQREHQP